MTNPNNIVRVRARNGGRASVLEANAWAQIFKVGLLKGNGVIQNTSADMNVLVGGSSSNPDVLIAETPFGYKVALDLVGQQAVAITAPASNSRISSIVAYTDDLSLSSSDATVTGSPSSCGLIVVNGTSASSPSAPDDATIRSAITADGATGSQAAYVVIANVTVASSTTAITNSLIDVFSSTDGLIQARNIDWATRVIDVTQIAPWGSERITATKLGKLVILSMANWKLGGSGDYTDVATLPDELIPDKEYSACGVALESGYRPIAPASIIVRSDGAIRIRVNTSSAYYVRGEIIYYTS